LPSPEKAKKNSQIGGEKKETEIRKSPRSNQTAPEESIAKGNAQLRKGEGSLGVGRVRCFIEFA